MPCEDLQQNGRLTIHRASNLFFRLQAELKRARNLRNHLPNQQLLRQADATVQILERRVWQPLALALCRWRDRKEAFAEWKQCDALLRTALERFFPSGCEVVAGDAQPDPARRGSIDLFLCVTNASRRSMRSSVTSRGPQAVIGSHFRAGGELLGSRRALFRVSEPGHKAFMAGK